MIVYSVEGLPGCGKSLFCQLLKQQLMLNEYQLYEDNILVIEEPENLQTVFHPFARESDDLVMLTLDHAFADIERTGWFYVIMKCLGRLAHFRRCVSNYKTMHGGQEPRVVVIENWNGSFERNIMLPYLIDEYGVENGEAILFKRMLEYMSHMYGLSSSIEEKYCIFIDCPLRVLDNHRNIDRILDGRLPPQNIIEELHTYIGVLEADSNFVVRNTIIANVDGLQDGVMQLLNDDVFVSHIL